MALPVIRALEERGVTVEVAIHPTHRPMLELFQLNFVDHLDRNGDVVTPCLRNLDGHATDWWIDELKVTPKKIIPQLDDDKLLQEARELVNQSDYFILSMDSRNHTKRPTQFFWDRIIDFLEGTDTPVIAVGPPDQKHYIDNILRNHPWVNNLSGKDSPILLPYILKNAKAVITTDTGTSHLSDALGIDTITVFVKRNEDIFHPYWNPRIALGVNDVKYHVEQIINEKSKQ